MQRRRWIAIHLRVSFWIHGLDLHSRQDECAHRPNQERLIYLKHQEFSVVRNNRAQKESTSKEESSNWERISFVDPTAVMLPSAPTTKAPSLIMEIYREMRVEGRPLKTANFALIFAPLERFFTVTHGNKLRHVFHEEFRGHPGKLQRPNQEQWPTDRPVYIFRQFITDFHCFLSIKSSLTLTQFHASTPGWLHSYCGGSVKQGLGEGKLSWPGINNYYPRRIWTCPRNVGHMWCFPITLFVTHYP